MAAYTAKTALLSSLIDYAGTFPPAALPLDQALVQACQFRKKAQNPWLLSKIVVTIADLKRLSTRAWVEAGSDGTPLPLTVIGSAVEKPEDLVRTLSFELREVRRFNEKFQDSSLRQWVVSYETRIPETAAPEILQDLLSAALESSLKGESLGAGVFFEIPLGDGWQERLARSSRALAEWSEENPDCFGQPGIKIRTGGKNPPSPEQLAEIIAVCTTHQLRFKATQGLHHAISRKGDFGFVNVFGAFALAQALGVETFSPAEIARCLADTDSAAFRFRENTFEWGEYRLETEQIEAARRIHCGTFGSCSLDEPDVFLAEELVESK